MAEVVLTILLNASDDTKDGAVPAKTIFYQRSTVRGRGRGRGCGRGRGTNRGRGRPCGRERDSSRGFSGRSPTGRGRASYNRRRTNADASEGWQLHDSAEAKGVLERDVAGTALSERVRIFCSSGMGLRKIEWRAKGLRALRLSVLDITETEIDQMRALAKGLRGKRIMCFNSQDGIKLRLQVRIQQQHQLPKTKLLLSLCSR